MKTLKFKSLILAAALVVMSGFAATSVYAQRSGRGGGGGMRGGGGSFHSGGGSFHSGGGSFRGGSISRSSTHISTNVHVGARIGGRGYYGRPGFWGYRRPYYAYYNFYRPYLGLSFSVLPFGYYPFYFGADQFYFSDGLFYRQYDDSYKVVVPPVGAQVPSIPSDAKEVTINGQTYYEYKGVYYTIGKSADGKTVYVVSGKDGVLNTDNGSATNAAGTGPMVGDVVTQLPDNYREVLIKGIKYYVSEDGVYYEQVVDGNKVTYKVVGLGN
ncbi:DUF6515 family protein [Pedobacter nutrimenti]|jgi:hypothetical protein|nr:DUF6515 family protein [Pedobacter nutrimenti]